MHQTEMLDLFVLFVKHLGRAGPFLVLAVLVVILPLNLLIGSRRYPIGNGERAINVQHHLFPPLLHNVDVSLTQLESVGAKLGGEDGVDAIGVAGRVRVGKERRGNDTIFLCHGQYEDIVQYLRYCSGSAGLTDKTRKDPMPASVRRRSGEKPSNDARVDRLVFELDHLPVQGQLAPSTLFRQVNKESADSRKKLAFSSLS